MHGYFAVYTFYHCIKIKRKLIIHLLAVPTIVEDKIIFVRPTQNVKMIQQRYHVNICCPYTDYILWTGSQ